MRVNIDWKNSKTAFLKRWPLEVVEKMTLDEYTNTNREDSFTYWLEKKTEDVISIWGGSAYKFGLFKRSKDAKIKDLQSSQYGDKEREYGWYKKYGETKEEAFENIKINLIKTVKFAQNSNFKEIDGINLGNSIKWKISYMYAPDETLLRIVKDEALKYLYNKHISGSGKLISLIQKELILNKPVEIDFDIYSESLWEEYANEKVNEKKFIDWLKTQKSLAKNTINKYVSKLNNVIPKKLLEIDPFVKKISIFDCETDYVQEIETEFDSGNKLHEWNKSPRINGEASAAIRNYLEFLEVDQTKNSPIHKYTPEQLNILSRTVYKLYLKKYQSSESLLYSIIPSVNKSIIKDTALNTGIKIGTAENYSERLFNLFNELNDFDIHNGLKGVPTLLRQEGVKIFNKIDFQNDSLNNELSMLEDLDKRVKEAEKMTHEERLVALSKSNPIPKNIPIKTTTFARNALVIVEVLERANGNCEGCKKPAPFIRAKDNSPYLEVHHIIQLSDDGPDTVANAKALCPNCHRNRHFGVDFK